MTPTFKGTTRPMQPTIGGLTGRGRDAQKMELAKKAAEARQAAAVATDKDINMLPTPVVRSATPPMSDMEKIAQGQNSAGNANSAQNAAMLQQAAQSAAALQKQQAAGPTNMPTPMKRGGSVKAYKAGGTVSPKKEAVRGWGIARSARKAKIV